MPKHQQLRTLVNFSSKPYIETRDPKKKGKTELLQTERKEKEAKAAAKLTQQQITNFSPRHLQVRTFKNFLQKLPKYASFLRHKYKKKWQKRTYSESSKRRTLGLRSKNPCASHPPRRTLARALFPSLSALQVPSLVVRKNWTKP